MKLSAEEEAMLAGEFGLARQWAIEHQLQVGRMFDAADMVAVSQAHMMADPESLGDAGVAFVERFAGLPETERRVAIPMITDPRGVDLTYYDPLGQTEEMADLERRFIAACLKLGIVHVRNISTVENPFERCTGTARRRSGTAARPARSVCPVRTRDESHRRRIRRARADDQPPAADPCRDGGG